MTEPRGPKARQASLLACAILAAVLLLAAPSRAPAQGCTMCRETAAMQKDRALTALQRGIGVLAVPPLAIATGVVWLVWKRRNRFASE
ncbi:MAG: hypothetical protein OXJ37_21180 [Bryobacterales bacterium]|nr:hypothetical protein [Bryobacterales bacterium]MDE0264930.1 hypothetical protein [Bryobacterales bacterium]MDE0624079.1 hypothetical protein [Bryobacterales bacterium]